MFSDKFKSLTTWCGVGLAACLQKIGVHSWSDAANIMSFLAGAAAFAYSMLLIYDWFQKRRKGRRK